MREDLQKVAGLGRGKAGSREGAKCQHQAAWIEGQADVNTDRRFELSPGEGIGEWQGLGCGGEHMPQLKVQN